MFVFIIVACGSGLYGEDCMHQCSPNCNEGNTCDRFTGQCIGGCKPGWTGTMCDQGKYVKRFTSVVTIVADYQKIVAEGCRSATIDNKFLSSIVVKIQSRDGSPFIA